MMTMCYVLPSPIPSMDSSAKNPLQLQAVIHCPQLQVQGINTLRLSYSYNGYLAEVGHCKHGRYESSVQVTPSRILAE